MVFSNITSHTALSRATNKKKKEATYSILYFALLILVETDLFNAVSHLFETKVDLMLT